MVDADNLVHIFITSTYQYPFLWLKYWHSDKATCSDVLTKNIIALNHRVCHSVSDCTHSATQCGAGTQRSMLTFWGRHLFESDYKIINFMPCVFSNVVVGRQVKSHNQIWTIWVIDFNTLLLHYGNLSQEFSKCIFDQVHQLSCHADPISTWITLVWMLKNFIIFLHATAQERWVRE